jgi:hypothetical protein
MKKKILVLTAGLLLLGFGLSHGTGDLIVNGQLGVGTSTPDQKLVVEEGLIKTVGTYGNQGFVSDFITGGDIPAAASLVSGLERATFLFSTCGSCIGGPKAFAIQARPRANVLLGQTARADTVFEIKEDGRSSIGKYDPEAFLDVSASGITSLDFFRLSSDDTTGGDIFIVTNTGNVGIGTANPQGTLDVNGPIYQRGGSLHADYVFNPDYGLESIEEHAQFMWTNKHLKSIPKAAEDSKGQEFVEIGRHQRGIVEELEKAHIYIEQMHKQIKMLEARLSKMEMKENAAEQR